MKNYQSNSYPSPYRHLSVGLKDESEAFLPPLTYTVLVLNAQVMQVYQKMHSRSPLQIIPPKSGCKSPQVAAADNSLQICKSVDPTGCRL